MLHVGVHELPLASVGVHVPACPFASGAVASHTLPVHTAELTESAPEKHVLVPDRV